MLLRLRFILEYFLILIFGLVLRIIPEKSVPTLSRILAKFIRRFFPYRKKVILTNLKIAFPELSGEQREELLLKIYEHLLLLIFEIILLFRWEDERVLEVVDISNIREYLREIQKGGILLSGHFGNWEIFARALCLNNFPLSVIMKPQKNPMVNNAIVRWRNKVGMEVIFTRGALKKSLVAIKNGQIVSILGDQDARSKGIFSDFFSRPSSTHIGAAVMSYVSEKPVLMAVGLRDEFGKYHAEGTILDPVKLKKECQMDKELYIQKFVDAYNQFMESMIRQYPDQYFWFHKRWKTSPPDIPKVDYKK